MTSEVYPDHFELTYDKKVNVIRCIGDRFYPSELKIKLQFQILHEFDDYFLTVLIGKMDYFFDFVVTDSIIVDKNNDSMTDVILDGDGFPIKGNNVILTPGDPSDALLSILFQSKMTAISGDFLDIYASEVSSSNTLGISTKFLGYGPDYLPTQSDWFGENSWYDQPWWMRPDASTMDAENFHTTNLEIPPFNRTFDEIEELISEIDNPTNVVVVDFEGFKPRIVEDED